MRTALRSITQVEPAAAAATAGDGAELAADLDQLVAQLVGAARWGTGRCRRGWQYALVMPTMRVEVARADAGAHARAAGGRVRRRDERIGAVVEVEERGLRAFQQQRVVAVERLVQHLDGVAHVRARGGRRARLNCATMASTSSASPPSAVDLAVVRTASAPSPASANAAGSSTSPARRPMRRALSA